MGSLSRLPPEFSLVVACCRWPPSPDGAAAVRQAASGVDWAVLLKVAKRHRVEALVWHALRRAEVAVPEPVARQLAADAARITQQNLLFVAESVRLKALFASEDVPLLFIKGVTLATLAYGTLSLKMGWDIDVLVPRRGLSSAAEILKRAGYRLTTPEPSSDPEQIERWHSRSKESVWRDDRRGIFLELHTGLVDNQLLLRGLSPFASPQQVEVARGVTLPTLPEHDLFAYLSVHGASSAWFRLKWLADVAALLSSYDAGRIEQAYRRSQQLGAGRAAAQALLLAARLFGTKLGAQLENELRSSPGNVSLYRSGLRAMSGRSFATELDEIRFGTAIIHLSQLRLLPGWRFKAVEAWRQIRTMQSPLKLLLKRSGRQAQP